MSTATIDHAATLATVAGIEDYWERRTFRSQRRSDDPMADRIILDMLGLGIEQAIPYLARERPHLDGFAAWIERTAGPIDADKLARYNAWRAGAEPPPATRRALATIDAMPPVLGPAELAHWDEHGYVVVRSAITADEAAAAASLLWRVIGADRSDPATWYGPRTNGIMIQHFQDPALEVARRSARIHKAFAQLYGTSDLWSSTDRMSFNPPEHAGYQFTGPHLHWDMSLAQPMPLSTGGILYLTDTAADQGALRVVPGFHRRLPAWLAGLGDADPRTIDLSAEAVPVPGGAGDLVIWRQELPHGASRNVTKLPRLAQYVNRYSPEQREATVWI